MRFAIADPPYLGRAATWYGGAVHSPRASTPGRVHGRTAAHREFHPDHARWDDPGSHVDLMRDLEAGYDG